LAPLERLDALQRRITVLAFAWAVQKKFMEDRGSYLAATITYYGFLAIFPLLLAAFTIVAYVLSGNNSAVNTLEKHLSSYPILGPAAAQLRGKTLKGSAIALLAGLIGLLWGATGLARAVQYTMDQAWNVTNKDRRSFGHRTLIGLGWYAVIGLGVAASTFVASVGSVLGWANGPVLSGLMALGMNVGLFLVSFRIVSPPGLTWRDLLPGAVFAALSWTILTGIGVGLARRLAHSNELYGSFAPILALLAFLYLTSRLTIYGIEANVVRAHKLWPRSLTTTNLGEADKEQLARLAEREKRSDGEHVKVEF
jgi:YihY family inner membrane protein